MNNIGDQPHIISSYNREEKRIYIIFYRSKGGFSNDIRRWLVWLKAAGIVAKVWPSASTLLGAAYCDQATNHQSLCFLYLTESRPDLLDLGGHEQTDAHSNRSPQHMSIFLQLCWVQASPRDLVLLGYEAYVVG